MTLHQLYADREAYRLPVYSVRQAAHLTGLPVATVVEWRKIRPAAAAPPPEKPEGGVSLSFLDLVELHLLAAIRHHRRVPVAKVQPALAYLREQLHQGRLPTQHPPTAEAFAEVLARCLPDETGPGAANARHRVLSREVLQVYWERVVRAADGFPLRLFPLYQRSGPGPEAVRAQPALISVDPTIAFGRPVLAGANVPVDVVVSRYQAGDSVHELAHDFRVPAQAIEEAIRYELRRAA